jgi:hypothetical protein
MVERRSVVRRQRIARVLGARSRATSGSTIEEAVRGELDRSDTLEHAVLAYVDRRIPRDLEVLARAVSAARWSRASTYLDMSMRRWMVVV